MIGIPKIIRHFSNRISLNILGIETSCDDTAVAIVNSKKRVISSRRVTNRNVQIEMGGINPSVCAEQHRQHLPRLIQEVLEESKLVAIELDGVAVTVTPGLVIALKEGIKSAIEFSRNHNLPLIPVHHMKAHALSILLENENIKFPFSTFLLSGGHALIAVAQDYDDFRLYGKCTSGSPGECMDKVAREMSIGAEFKDIHPGAAIELLAKRCSPDGHLRYTSVLPSTSGADMNFSQLKSTYLNMIRKLKTADEEFSTEDFAASLQHSVSRHLCSKLHAFYDWYTNSDPNYSKQLVVGGGVASNGYILNAISKVARAYDVETFQVPHYLCTDNAEMVAYTGILKMENGSKSIIEASEIPDMLYAHARTDIGTDCRSELPSKPRRRLAVSTIHSDIPLRFHEYPPSDPSTNN